MTNDLSTLSGALLEMKDQLIYELGQKGVTASYSSSDGLLGLIGKISEIQTGGGGSCYKVTFDNASYNTSGSVTVSVTVLKNYSACVGETVTFTSSTSTTTTATTDSNGVATWTVKCPSSAVWDTSSKTKGSVLTKTTTYKKYYVCDVTAYGTGYYKNTDSFSVISKKPKVVKKYKIIKKKITKTIKVKSGERLYKWGKYAAATYKYKSGYFTYVNTAVGKKNSGLISFFIKHHYKKNGKWKWTKWKKMPKGYYSEYSYGSAIKCDKLKVKYTQVTYKRI